MPSGWSPEIKEIEGSFLCGVLAVRWAAWQIGGDYTGTFNLSGYPRCPR